MKKKEKELFKSLCSFKQENFDEGLLEAATPNVLGHLFFNRMQAVAYGVLKQNNLLAKVNREFRNSLKGAYEQNLEKNISYFRCVKYIGRLLSNCKCNYAMLKGAYLCRYYPEGYRTSNDVDLLVMPQDVTEIGNILIRAGFKQGNIRNGDFVPATRREIIESKMLRGETVPYIKEINLPQMRFLEVDVNFSLDYKNGDEDVLKQILERSQEKEIGDLIVRTLTDEDFFVHLCNHLYKEATTLPWVEMLRDMTLYKYCDIYMLLNNLTRMETGMLFKRARQLGMEKICSFAVIQTNAMFKFENEYAVALAEEFLKYEPDFIHTVIVPQAKKRLVFKEKEVLKRLFSDNRKKLLKEED